MKFKTNAKIVDEIYQEAKKPIKVGKYHYGIVMEDSVDK